MMANLIGSQKQVEWAQDLREATLARAAQAREVLAAVIPSSAESLDRIVAEAGETSDASWWIEHGMLGTFSAKYLRPDEYIDCLLFPAWLVDGWMDQLPDADVVRLMGWQRFEGLPSFSARLSDFRNPDRRNDMRDVVLEKVCRLYLQATT
jgi:hypothetical protein